MELDPSISPCSFVEFLRLWTLRFVVLFFFLFFFSKFQAICHPGRREFTGRVNDFVPTKKPYPCSGHFIIENAYSNHLSLQLNFQTCTEAINNRYQSSVYCKVNVQNVYVFMLCTTIQLLRCKHRLFGVSTITCIPVVVVHMNTDIRALVE